MGALERDICLSNHFDKAKAVWPAGRSDIWNQMAGFHAGVMIDDPPTGMVLRITAADAYRIWINGEHAGYGPARTALGYARVDEWPLDRHVRVGLNQIAIEVHSHGIDSYVYVMQPPFLQAELLCEGKVVAATPDSFTACVLPERVQKVERYSKQRPFAEAYRLTPDCNAWRTGQGDRTETVCEAVPAPCLLPRHVLLPHSHCIAPAAGIGGGKVSLKEYPPELPRSATREGVGKRVRGYPVDELEIDIVAELNRLDFVEDEVTFEVENRTIPAQGHALYDFGRVQGGFVGLRVSCEAPTRIYLVLNELRGRAFVLGIGAIALDLAPGVHAFESMEPYSLRYLRVVTMGSDVNVESVYVREYVYPKDDHVNYTGEDEVLAGVFAAARQTFRTNSVDLFTDCPSRERGGYPCDAWFTARAERLLTGESRIEHNFLENYFLPDSFDGIPDGMVPHCYPSSRLGTGAYIPNWAMWLLLQLADYCERTGDEALRELARPRVKALVEWFRPHLNDQGLLEDLPGWIFVEWSPANDYTDGVNHPTNMLYALCLDAVGRLYEQADWVAQADRMREAIRETSWDGQWFADQSLRVDGQLKRSGARTETCQYHALWCGIADQEQTKALWPRLRDNWGPCRGKEMGPADNGAKLVPAGLLFGILLRFDLLQQNGERTRLLNEVRAVFGPQAKQTGTLWEHVTGRSSCNHGFSSCACVYFCDAAASR